MIITANTWIGPESSYLSYSHLSFCRPKQRERLIGKEFCNQNVWNLAERFGKRRVRFKIIGDRIICCLQFQIPTNADGARGQLVCTVEYLTSLESKFSSTSAWVLVGRCRSPTKFGRQEMLQNGGLCCCQALHKRLGGCYYGGGSSNFLCNEWQIFKIKILGRSEWVMRRLLRRISTKLKSAGLTCSWVGVAVWATAKDFLKNEKLHLSSEKVMRRLDGTGISLLNSWRIDFPLVRARVAKASVWWCG